ncbi:unnamed protein product [Brassica rapa]|uniref:Uncharacterized protein n=1 Tax=Brassica campestris TaxID=3711 RepID=A0A8D9CWJ9_BRACM|nr:unnamed protein product [Brassica rapa]
MSSSKFAIFCVVLFSFVSLHEGFNHRHLLAVPRPCSPTANGKWCCYPSGFAYCNDSQRRCEKQCKAIP